MIESTQSKPNCTKTTKIMQVESELPSGICLGEEADRESKQTDDSVASRLARTS